MSSNDQITTKYFLKKAAHADYNTLQSSHAMNEKILSTKENSTKSHNNFFLILTICIAFKRGEMSKYNLLPYLKRLKFLPLPNHTFTPFFSSIIVECISMICIVCNRFL